MTLYKGTKKVAPIINKANTVRNQSKVITSNGVHNADNGYTGLGPVTVNVSYNAEPLTVTVNEQKTYNINPASVNLDGFNNVTINVDINLQNKNYTITQADLNNPTITVTPDSGYSGFSSFTIDLSTLINILSQI